MTSPALETAPAAAEPAMNLALPKESDDTLVPLPRYERRDYRVMKRIFDVVASASLLLALFPLFLLVSLLIAFADGAPVLFKQRRVGLGGQLFWIYKFRTMRRDAEEILRRDPVLLEEYRRTYKLANDPRLLPFGKLMRSLTVDELPQLFNVLKGDVSLVGPRPIVEPEQERYGAAIEVYKKMKPGCAGLWQHRGRSDLSYDQRVAYDVEYYRTASIRRDLLTLLRTVVAVFARRGAV